MTSTSNVNNHALFTGARHEKKTVKALPAQEQPGEETTPKRFPYHITVGVPLTHELPQKWMENEGLLCYLRGEVKPPPSIKAEKSSRINDLVLSFPTLLIALRPRNISKNCIPRIPLMIILMLHSSSPVLSVTNSNMQETCTTI